MKKLNKRSKPWIITSILAGLVVFTMMFAPRANAQEEFPQRVWVDTQFMARAYPEAQAEHIGTFSPQYVTVLQTGEDGWKQICTYRGNAWINPELTQGQRWTDNCVDVISRMVWGEGRGVNRNEQKLIVWTVINRYEHGGYGSSLVGVVRARGQFHGYSPRFPVTDEIRGVVIEVLSAWERGEEAKVYPPFARTSDYLYFWGDGTHNWFRRSW